MTLTKENYDLLVTAEGCIAGVIINIESTRDLMDKNQFEKLKVMRNDLKEMIAVQD